jgi:hypothetical protein
VSIPQGESISFPPGESISYPTEESITLIPADSTSFPLGYSFPTGSSITPGYYFPTDASFPPGFSFPAGMPLPTKINWITASLTSQQFPIISTTFPVIYTVTKVADGVTIVGTYTATTISEFLSLRASTTITTPEHGYSTTLVIYASGVAWWLIGKVRIYLRCNDF